jgi:hypothetical protein
MKARLAVDVWRLVVGGRPEGPWKNSPGFTLGNQLLGESVCRTVRANR